MPTEVQTPPSSEGRQAVTDSAAPAAPDERQWQTVARIRAQTSGWVLMWSARKGEFQARPLFRAPKDTVATGRTPEELAAKMLEIETRAGRTTPAAEADDTQPAAPGCEDKPCRS
jgi:hypothetical protein